MLPRNVQYIHGYSSTETSRLCDQAETLTDIIHHDSYFPDGSSILEAGCGVGAQTITLVTQNPTSRIVSIDLSEDSLALAKKRCQDAGYNQVEFKQADIYHLKFPEACFDHIFVCFVLEHLNDPITALQSLYKVLKPGGSITVIEGDHGSCFFYPPSIYAQQAINSLIQLQAKSGGNSLIGRELYPLFKKTNFKNIHISPRMLYIDALKPELVDGFIRKTFTAMVKAVEKQALQKNLISSDIWLRGIDDLYRTTENDGTFCYTFFKARAIK
jgi:ubiquinone/menaquinone biosynthesis C-methylase UbiE